MESTETYQAKLEVVRKAIISFGKLLAVDLSLFREVIADGIKNGQIQKFEYCTELLWKQIKRFLLERDGIDASTPKAAIKEFYLAGYVSEADYEILSDMLDDRNKLSHIYKEEYFSEILEKLKSYLVVMQRVSDILKQDKI